MSEITTSRRAFVEPLEARIAPAGVLTANWKTATFGAPIELFAGDGLSTGGSGSGSYLLYVDKGSAFVFLTDLNNNGDVDYNEVTGVAAGDGLRLTSFVDIHGDITTNLTQVTATISGVVTTRLALTDSDNNRSNDVGNLGDGRVLANSTIESITLRSLRLADLTDQNADGLVDERDVALRKVYTTYSIYGDIIAGRGFGVAGVGAATGGLTIDTTNESGLEENFGFAVPPSVGAIRTGTAGSGQFFSYGSSNRDDINGTFVKFVTPTSQTGGDIIGVRAAGNVRFNVGGFYTGEGGLGARGADQNITGIGARGGDIRDITLNGDDSAGYEVITGNGGRGTSGGMGGSILNFTDLQSTTGRVLIRSGSGGAGSSAAGGNAGNLSIGTFNVFGNVFIDLGSGGNGFTSGGNGAALTKGLFDQPTATAYVSGNGVGTMHQPLRYDPLGLVAPTYGAQFGTTTGIDFDGDGFGDIVYTSRETSVLVVQFGDGTGGARRTTLPDGTTIFDRLYLSGVRNAEALTVGDFDGDGRPDIATASVDQGWQGGVAVFLNKGFKDTFRKNGVRDVGVDGTPLEDFLGFAAPRYSNLPQFDRADPDVRYTVDGGTFPPGVLPYWAGPAQIASLTSGDYDGDGRVEIAAVITRYALKTTDPASGLTTNLDRAGQVLVFLTPDMERDNATGRNVFTGQFYADFGTRERIENGVLIPAAPRLPMQAIDGFSSQNNLEGTSDNFTSVVVETSALRTVSTNDVVFVGVRGASQNRVVSVFEYRNRDLTPGGLTQDPALLGVYSLGRVDTNRDLGADKISSSNYTLRDFSVGDFDENGTADLAVLSLSPALYLTFLGGDGFGTGAALSGGLTQDNAGNFFGDKGIDLNAPELMALKTVAFDTPSLLSGNSDGRFNDVAILDSTGDWVVVGYRAGPQLTDAPPTATTGAIFKTSFLGTTFVADAGDEFFAGTFVPRVTDRPHSMSVFVSFGTNAVFSDPLNFAFTTSDTPPVVFYRFDIFQIAERNFRLEAGDGGNAAIGNGGVGGLIGSGSTLLKTIDPNSGLPFTDLTGSVEINITGTARVYAGNGGNGLTSGGKGGTISGVKIRTIGLDPLDDDLATIGTTGGVSASLVAGNGGRGVSGNGGAGGDLTQNSVSGGVSFIAGDGGSGRVGGSGGNIVGNGSSVFDSIATSIRLVAGDGGNGVRGGGNGGGISGFSPLVGRPSVDLAYSLSYIAGNGGDAVAGPGGRGGSVANSGPREGDGIQAEIRVAAGNGGDGLTGGAGGSIANFVSKPAPNSKKPDIVSLLAGNGGDGLAGDGGVGGNVSGITVPTRGGVGNLTGYAFSRILAGNGGDSASARGGNGGTVSDISGTGASEGSIALVGGAGGAGLWAGGNGGSVARIDLFLPASAATKGLIVGGEGGEARAFVTNVRDGDAASQASQSARAFGGRIGIGGNGGNVTDITQRGNVGSHFDLIAGNGGDTANYGSLRDTVAYVGKGGSIARVKLSGDIGNLQRDEPGTAPNEDIPIKSYNDIRNNQTMAQWVDANLRAATAVFNLSDAGGNVGVVVGAAGLNKAVVTDPTNAPTKYVPLPAPNTVNGNLIDIEARNIMSALAGNVERIARIQIAQNIRVLGGIIGADKGRFQQNDYLDVNGTLTVDGRPVLDGRLVDGAFIARSILTAAGAVTTLPGRIYNL